MNLEFPIRILLRGIARNDCAISLRGTTLKLRTRKHLNIRGIICNGIAFPYKNQ